VARASFERKQQNMDAACSNIKSLRRVTLSNFQHVGGPRDRVAKATLGPAMPTGTIVKVQIYGLQPRCMRQNVGANGP